MKIIVFMYLSFKFLHVTIKFEPRMQRMLVKLCRSDTLCCGCRRKHIYVTQQLHSEVGTEVSLILDSVRVSLFVVQFSDRIYPEVWIRLTAHRQTFLRPSNKVLQLLLRFCHSGSPEVTRGKSTHMVISHRFKRDRKVNMKQY